ncbi:MAG: hypothetical protein IJS28_07135 [Synergistaceae bacterium]|nr:hypothetical protein [Synergistaceae bacterium]
MENEYSRLWQDTRNILVSAITAIEEKSAAIPHYQDKQYAIQKYKMNRAIEWLLTALDEIDGMCFGTDDEED